ncbi:MAG: hypothetical protein QM811_23060 [Pirellulales bacterium]
MSDDEDKLIRSSEGSESVARMLLNQFSKNVWSPWEYNQVVGWLRIYAYPKQGFSSPVVEGEFFAVDAKRYSISLKNKRFLWAGEAFSVVIDRERGVAVFERIMREIDQWATSEPLKKMTLDLSAWSNVGKFLDWDNLLRLDEIID